MNAVRQEIESLNHKVNQLYHFIHKLSEYVGWQEKEKLAFSFGANRDSITEDNNTSDSRPSEWQEDINPNLVYLAQKEERDILTNTHKDILSDFDPENKYQNVSGYGYREDSNISCEDKVQRLTAQLTAAYHRIAALEDQLIAHRHHLETRQQGFHHHH